MSNFVSKFRPAIDTMLAYRVALGLSSNSTAQQLARFDCYCAEHHPNCEELTKELVFEWLNSRADTGIITNNEASALRGFAEYLTAIGKPAYVLPHGFYTAKKSFTAYIFTDAELSALFGAIDMLPNRRASTASLVAPVLFRLIYTCGLRPNEGRELLRENVNLDNGEIYVTNTKKKKDRIIVMSSDMLALCREYAAKKLLKGVYFFPRSDGKCYTTAQQDKLFKKCWGSANPDIADLPNVRTYDLRHRFASARLNRWIDEGVDLNNKLPYLRAYMGHKNLSETAYYIHILPENLIKSAGVNWTALGAILPEVTQWDE